MIHDLPKDLVEDSRKLLQQGADYEEFFKKALKKFGVNSPADFKSDEEKKKFFDYVDKNFKGKNEGVSVKEYFRGFQLDEMAMTYVLDNQKEADMFVKKIEKFVDSAVAEKGFGMFRVNVKGSKQALKKAMMKSVALLQTCSFDEISKTINDALKLGSDNNFGYDYLTDFEERFKLVLAALKKKGKTIMFVDEAHMMNGAGAGGANSSNDLANMLKPALTKGDLKVVASTTWEEYRKFFENDRALMRRFQRVTVDEPSKEVTTDILRGIKKYYEGYHNTVITEEAIEESIKLSVKYQTDKKLPDKAIDLIDVACSRFNLKDVKGDKIVGRDEIQFELAKIIKLPEEQVAEKETENLANLESNLKKSVYGQDPAIEGIVDKILVAQAGLKPDNKPIGSFVFMGPTGVGKTETAKQLAKQLGVQLVRFDMSEYQEKHAVAKLIGSPPGYVGYEDSAGLLITKLQEHPNCVLLLDEIEKAHPDVSQILLQVMDNGKLMGSNGKEADARNCVLILTTNLGATEAEKNTIGFSSEWEGAYEDTELKKFFAPEFRNRLDGTITFGKLSKEIMMKIVGKFLVELRDMVQPKNITIKIDDKALDILVDKGFNPKMGARPLQRVIDKEIKRPLSREMLFGKLKNGGTVTINVNDSKEFTLEVAEKEVAVANT